MKHDFEKRNDGLACCLVCKAAEGELTTDCPGVPLSAQTRAVAYAAMVDFANGAWVPGVFQAVASRISDKLPPQEVDAKDFRENLIRFQHRNILQQLAEDFIEKQL